MKKIALLFFICGMVFRGISQVPQNFDLGGDWEFRKSGTEQWYPAKVPGSVHLDLMRNRMIKDPFFRANEDSVQWVSDTGWEYRRVFYIDKTMLSSHRIDLDFKGLDTYANVYLNDSLILVADNMFREWYLDNIKTRLYLGRNELRIQFPSVTRTNKELYDKLGQKLPGDEKVVCRKAAYQFGWDWGPRLITCGIWKPVFLRLWNQVNIHNVQFIQKSMKDSVASMSAVFTVNSTLTDTVEFTISNDTVPLFTGPALVKRGLNSVRLDFKIRKPKLWWPNGVGLGGPYLYTMKYSVKLGNQIVDKGSQKIGIRTIELVQQRDTVGRSFVILVNNTPVFIKGANYIPQDNFTTRVRDTVYRNLLTDVKNSKMNMLRVWGGGIYENDIFYDLCDELGILVWQDFMFACAMYPSNKEFLQNINAESIQNIVRLRNHPCLALWCGNNEINEGWKNWGWVKQYKYSPEDSAAVYQGYKTIFNGLLATNVRKFDTLRSYIPTSPMFGWGTPESRVAGDMHYWGVWWGKEPFSSYNTVVGRFMSEYGFQSFPEMKSFINFTRPEDLKLGSPVMKAHQKHPVGYELIDEYMKREYRTPKDFASYTYVSQILQAEGIKTAIEAHMRSIPGCMGTMFWQYNDCWPVVSWSARDYFGNYKALHYYLPREFSDVLLSPVIENGRLKVYLVNQRYAIVAGDFRVKLTDFSGKVFYDTTYDAANNFFQKRCWFDMDTASLLQGVDPSKVVFSVSFRTWGYKHDLFTNVFYFRPVKDLDLPRPGIKKEISEVPGGYKIRLTSDKLAKNVWIYTFAKGKFSDNFMDILPGESVEMIFTTSDKVKDLAALLIIRTIADTY
jgi:beta-mannosidase